MMKLGTAIMIILLLRKLCNCSPHTRILLNKNISKYKSFNGEPVAVAHSVQEYEHDHIKLFNKEVNKNNNLEWKDVENKDLNEYCRRYLNQCVPGRNTCNATGIKSIRKLRYTSGYGSLRNSIVVISCVNSAERTFWYYLTRAPEPNCVYALSRSSGGNWLAGVFTIIYKHCDFEHYDYDRNREQKKRDMKKVDPIKYICNKDSMKQCEKVYQYRHRRTGQIIADNKFIRECELEHQKMHKLETIIDFDSWTTVMQHSNLNEYCYKYLNVCIPNRNIEGVIGIWNFQKIRWRSNEELSIPTIVVKCYIPTSPLRSYYFTPALDANCVYALLRDGKHAKDPFVIISKYCNFEHSNTKQNTLENREFSDRSITFPQKIKTENLHVESLKFFPNN